MDQHAQNAYRGRRRLASMVAHICEDASIRAPQPAGAAGADEPEAAEGNVVLPLFCMGDASQGR
jgi:hypothetical protein